MEIRIKYFKDSVKLERIAKGNWIDVYARKDIFIPINERAMIPLGFALELPQGYEGHLAPRSSTFKCWGVIQTNSIGIVDDSYIGDNDEWHMPVYCLQGKGYKYTEEEILEQFGMNKESITVTTCIDKLVYRKDWWDTTADSIDNPKGTWIRKGDKIGQMRILEVQPNFELVEVDHFGNEDRGGFGTTGRR